MNRVGLLRGMILVASLASCTAEVPQRGSGSNRSDGVVEAITRREPPASSAAPGGAGVAGVAGVLAGGSLSTPPGAQVESRAGAKDGGVVAGVVASAIASPPTSSPADRPMYRVTVRLDSGRLKTVEQSDVSALSVGQHVRLQDDRVVPL